MEFNVTTFVLEIVNFLILLWILQRLFYRPVLEMITRRKQHIDESLSEAKQREQEAEHLRNRYENRQNLWEQEKQAAQIAFRQQLENERQIQMQELQQDLMEEREKAQVAVARQQQDVQKTIEKQALLNGARFAGLLLQEAAGPELEERLFRMLIDRLESLPDACRPCCLQELDNAGTGLSIKVASAFALNPDLCKSLEKKMETVIDCPKVFEYLVEPELISGIRIDIGSWVLHANLKHELAAFAEIAYESE